MKCDSETRSCASPEIVDCSGKCFTYHSVDEVGGTVVSDLQKGCYPKEDVEISCSCAACDTFQTMIGLFTDGKVDWSCKHHCCDDHDECNRHLHAPTCNVRSVYGFWIMAKLKSLNWIQTFVFISCRVPPGALKVKSRERMKRGCWILAGKNNKPFDAQSGSLAFKSLLYIYKCWKQSTSSAFSLPPYVKSLSEQLHRCLQQPGKRAVFKSETTLRSHLVRPKDAVDPA